MKPEMITYVFYSASVAFFIYILCAAVFKKKKMAFESGLLLSPVSAIILLCSDFIGGSTAPRTPIMSAACATLPLIVCVNMKDSRRMKSVNILAFSVCAAVTTLKVTSPSYIYRITMYAVSLVLALFIPCAKLAVLCRKISSNDLNHNLSRIETMSADVSSLYSNCFTAALLFAALPMAEDSFSCHAVHTVIGMIMMLTIYLCLYIRLFEDRLFVFLRKKEETLRQAQKLCIQEQVRTETTDEFSYKAIFDRMEAYFQSEKPFLEENLSIADIAKQIYTNKAYLSRAINMYTGRNFCQYVNYHRVKYSLELFESDPTMKISELAGMSGFHTPASFNMAFRLYMNETPGDWCRKVRLRNLDSGNGK